jgi:hypothetical protein
MEPLDFNAKPQLLQFETDTVCNAQCVFCEHPKMKRADKASWRTILNAVYKYGSKVVEVCPFGMQEPTLEPRLPAVLTNIKQMNSQVQTTIYSNMAHYDEAVWTNILKWEALDKLAVSYYGFDKETYERLQPPLKYGVAEANIKKLARLKRKLNVDKPEINLHLLVMPETYKKTAKFAKRMRAILGDDHVGLVKWDGWCGNKPFNDTFETFFWGKQAEHRYPCPRLWQVITIHSNGNLVPCCLDAHEQEACGNINIDDDPFQNNPRLQTLRTLHLKGEQDKIPLCANCTVWKREHDPVWNNLWKNNVSSAINPCIKSR